MRYSVNLESVCQGVPLPDAFARLETLGFDTCERWAFPATVDETIHALCQTHHIRLSCFCPDFFILNDPDQRNAYKSALEDACRRAKALGARKLITQVGMDTGASRQAQHNAIVSALRQFAPMLEGEGITLLIEPLNNVRDHPGYYLTSSDEGFDIITAVASPNVRLLYDVYHQLYMGEDVLAQIKKGLPLIGHFHVAGFPRRDERLFEVFDYRPLLSFLASADTDAYIGLEFFPSSFEAGVQTLKALKTFSNLPAYTRNPTYQALASICEDAGMRLQYAAIPPGLYARSRDAQIQMPTDMRFANDEHAAIVLGHELAHALVNTQYPEIEAETPLSLPRHMLLEADCDRMGTYLYMLAERMSTHKKGL